LTGLWSIHRIMQTDQRSERRDHAMAKKKKPFTLADLEKYRSRQGLLVANIMAAVAQGQSALISQRNKAIAARLRKLGRPRNGSNPLGYRRVGPKGARQCVPDVQERAIMAEIVRLRDEKGLTFEAISDQIEGKTCRHEGRPLQDPVWGKRKWPLQKCHRAYHAYKRILQEEGRTSRRA
jgi:hypothetical protein